MVTTWKRGAEGRNKEDASQSKRREVRRVWTEEQGSRLERKGEQTIPRIPSTSLAERERREEGRGCSER